jgi:hypothetical protein
MYNSKYVIGSGSKNKMYCLYHSFDDYSPFGLRNRCHHVANLSTDYNKAVNKAKNIADPNWNLIISEKPFELNKITRNGNTEKKLPKVEFVEEITDPKIQYPLSKPVGEVGERLTLTLGVTDSFTYQGRFGTGLCKKFIDANHNEYVSFSQAKFMWDLKVGDTVYCTAEIKFHNKRYDWNTNVIYETLITKIKGVK